MRKKVRLDEFQTPKTIDLTPPGFQVDRWQELPAILERIAQHVSQLSFAKVVPCDLCIENFLEDKIKQLELAGRILGEASYFSSQEMTPELLEQLYPEWNAQPSKELGRVRVHGFTKDGKYQTYCHFCDANMCLSKINQGPNWDEIYESRYLNFLQQLPELLGILLLPEEEQNEDSEEVVAVVPEVLGFYFDSSVSWKVNIELLVEPGRLNYDFVFFAHEGRKWTAHFLPANDPLAQQISDKYKSIQ